VTTPQEHDSLELSQTKVEGSEMKGHPYPTPGPELLHTTSASSPRGLTQAPVLDEGKATSEQTYFIHHYAYFKCFLV